ncbi:MAG: hypothetical protein Q8M16_21785 [Pirellulaceae bacterium]|nr:hypothetical protein [Pirellulaceae bacterium]
MALAVVSEITRQFKSIVAKREPDLEQTLECRFLLRDGFYVGHVLNWDAYRGVWFSDANEMKIYRNHEWLMSIPVRIDELEVAPPIPDANTVPGRADVRPSKSAA